MRPLHPRRRDAGFQKNCASVRSHRPDTLRERECFKWQKSLGGDQTLLRNKRRRMKYLAIRSGTPDRVFPLAQEFTAFPSRIYDDDHDHRSHRHN